MARALEPRIKMYFLAYFHQEKVGLPSTTSHWTSEIPLMFQPKCHLRQRIATKYQNNSSTANIEQLTSKKNIEQLIV
jgi:hypothetical protein